MCADCHSTDLRKNFDLATNSYQTTWSEIDVSCEACHGPGSRHVAWAQGARTAQPPTTSMDWLVSFRDPGGGMWDDRPDCREPRSARAPRQSIAEVETCARCHARRREIAASYSYGHPFLDTHMPALLDAGLYHADGQILDEVYEYGSFLQSRMFQMGVTCSDCHDPHSLQLRADGNAVCGQCHLPAKFDTEAHHHHPAGLGRRPVRQLPHADADLHGGRRPARSRDPHSATGSHRRHRHAQRLQQLPQRQDRRMGRGGGGALVWAEPPRRTRTTARSLMPGGRDSRAPTAT